MKTLAEIFYDAILADDDLMTTTGGRVVSTCFEIPPGNEDNTPLPNIIITNDGFTNNKSTKDVVWESDEDVVAATVNVAAGSPQEVDAIVAMVRKAIETYVCSMYASGQDTPELQEGFPQSNGIAWDWVKPCYYQEIVYSCVTKKFQGNEQEDN